MGPSVAFRIEMASRRVNSLVRLAGYRYMSSEPGSGAGKGGGSGGSIRDAGGTFGKIEAAREEEFIRKLQKKQLEMMKKSVNDDVAFHESQIKMHQEPKSNS